MKKSIRILFSKRPILSIKDTMVVQKQFNEEKDLRKQAWIKHELMIAESPLEIPSDQIKIINAKTMKP